MRMNPAHYDKNLGFALAVWDWAFGALVIPAKTREPVVFGLGAENALFRSLAGSFLKPFVPFSHHVARLLPERAGRAGQGLA